MGIFASLARVTAEFMKAGLSDLIRLEGMEDTNILTMKDGSLVSLIRLDGSLVMLGRHDVESVIEQLRVSLSPFLTHPGHAIEVSFIRDPGVSGHAIEEIVSKTRRSSNRLKLSLDDVLDERQNHLAKMMTLEELYIAVYTRPSVLTSDEAREGSEDVTKGIMAFPAMRYAQIPGKIIGEVTSRHNSLIYGLLQDLNNAGQVAELLDVETALQIIYGILYPSEAPYRKEWSPRLPAPFKNKSQNPSSIKMAPDTDEEMSSRDFSNLGVPTFDLQLATADAQVLDNAMIRIGDTVFSGFDLTLAPEVLTPFNDLVLSIDQNPVPVPWRVSFLLEAGGLQTLTWKEQYVRAFLFTAPTRNKRIRDAIDELREIDGVYDTAVRMRVSFATWAPREKLGELRRMTSIVKRAVERWGVCQADGLIGDMVQTVVCTIPGASVESTAPPVVPPLAHGLAMMPFDRQASPWHSGSLLLRTPDGKPWPFQPGSSLQNTFNTLLVGTPGSGKSVTLNALNLATALTVSATSDGDPQLPMIGIIDIGASSAGLISMIKEALPPEQRHEALFRQMKMEISHAINPFDTQLGMRRPLPSERNFLTNFMALVCSDGDKPPTSAMLGLIDSAIDQAYIDKGDTRNPNRYVEHDELEVDAALEALSVEVTEHTTWWDIVDTLMSAGRIHEAEIAQKHAVPVLADLVTASRQSQIENSYADVKDDNGQSIIDGFRRIISEVTRSFPILSTYTRFDVGSARITSLDLKEVTARGSGATAARQSAIMFMLARNVLVRNYFLDEEDFAAAITSGVLPSEYRDYHLQRARVSRETPKTLCIDEYHRTGGLSGINDQIELDMREGRKYNIRLSLASQRIDDFNAAIQDLSTGVIICNSASPAATKELVSIFGINHRGEAVLRNELTGPSSKGAPLYVIFKTRKGTVQQKLFLTLGPVEIWAFSTTAEDVALRKMLYEKIGPQKARAVLASRFPGGSAKAEIEARITRLEEAGQQGEDERGNIIGGLAEELRQQAIEH